MSTYPTQALPGPALPRQLALPQKQSSIDGMSATGVLLFVIGLCVVASGYVALRPEVGGMSLHASLIPMAMAFPFLVLSRLGAVPSRVLIGLVAFCGMYTFSVLVNGKLALNEIVKVNCTLMTIVTCALLVRKRGDFVAGSLGLSLAIAALAVPGLGTDVTTHGVEVLEGANKNTYSMFALPVVLLAGFIYLQMPTVPRIIKWVLIACATASLLVIFMSANRSGYVGAALVGMMLFWHRRGSGLILVAVMGSFIAGWLVYSGNTEALDRRMQQTVEGNSSDDSRITLMLAAAQVALENPIVGVSPQELPIHLARAASQQTGMTQHAYAAHNVFAHVIAGSGLFCFAALMYLGWAFWNPTPNLNKATADPTVLQFRRLLRMMVVLWVVRGMFTSEIHFNISFNIAFGLMLGGYMLVQSNSELTRGATALTQRKTPVSLSPNLG